MHISQYITSTFQNRKKYKNPVTEENPINLDKFFGDETTAQYAVIYLLKKNTQERELFLQQLDKESLQTFIGHLKALEVDPNLVVFPPFGHYFDLLRPNPQILKGHTNPIETIVFSPGGNFFVSGSWGKINNLILWNAKTGQQITILEGHPNDITIIAFSPDEHYFVSGSIGNKNNLILWDTKTGKQVTILKGHPDTITTITFSPNGHYFVSGSTGEKNNLILWETKTGKRIKIFTDQLDAVKAIAFSPDSQEFTSVTIHAVHLRKTKTGKTSLQKFDPTAIFTKISPDDQYVVGISVTHEVILYNIQTGDISRFKGHKDVITVETFSPDGTRIVSGSRILSDPKGGVKDNLIMWNTKTGQHKILKGHIGDRITAITFSPDGQYFVSGEAGPITWGSFEPIKSNVIVWDSKTGAQIKILAGHEGAIRAIIFSPDSTHFVSGSANNKNNLFFGNAKTGKQIKNLAGHSKGINVITFSPDSTQFVSGSSGTVNNLILWKLTPQWMSDKQIAFLYRVYWKIKQKERWFGLYQHLAQRQPFVMDQEDLQIFHSLDKDIQETIRKFINIP